MIRVKDLHKSFNGRMVLDGTSCKITFRKDTDVSFFSSKLEVSCLQEVIIKLSSIIEKRSFLFFILIAPLSKF